MILETNVNGFGLEISYPGNQEYKKYSNISICAIIEIIIWLIYNNIYIVNYINHDSLPDKSHTRLPNILKS